MSLVQNWVHKMNLSEEMAAWRESVEGGRFFGRPFSEMDRDELLSVIGSLVQKQRREYEERAKERAVLMGLHK